MTPAAKPGERGQRVSDSFLAKLISGEIAFCKSDERDVTHDLRDARATIARLTAENEALHSAKQISDAAATYWEDETRKARSDTATAQDKLRWLEAWEATEEAADPIKANRVLLMRDAIYRLCDETLQERKHAAREAIAALATAKRDAITEAVARIHRFQDIVGWQPGESRNALIGDIEAAVRALEPPESLAADVGGPEPEGERDD